MNLSEIIKDIFIENAFVMSFLLIAAGIAISGLISKYMFRGKIPTSAVAIVTGLVSLCRRKDNRRQPGYS